MDGWMAGSVTVLNEVYTVHVCVKVMPDIRVYVFPSMFLLSTELPIQQHNRH